MLKIIAWVAANPKKSVGAAVAVIGAYMTIAQATGLPVPEWVNALLVELKKLVG